jgi:hypothetical protein
MSSEIEFENAVKKNVRNTFDSDGWNRVSANFLLLFS